MTRYLAFAALVAVAIVLLSGTLLALFPVPDMTLRLAGAEINPHRLRRFLAPYAEDNLATEAVFFWIEVVAIVGGVGVYSSLREAGRRRLAKRDCLKALQVNVGRFNEFKADLDRLVSRYGQSPDAGAVDAIRDLISSEKLKPRDTLRKLQRCYRTYLASGGSTEDDMALYLSDIDKSCDSAIDAMQRLRFLDPGSSEVGLQMRLLSSDVSSAYSRCRLLLNKS